MGVIINKYEVIVEEPPAEDTVEPEPAEPQPGPALMPQDILDIIRHQMDRMERIKAL